MKFKIDENLPNEFVTVLAEAGYEAMTVSQQGLTGNGDPDIVAVCQREDRILITADLDLSDIRQYPPDSSPGFVVLRLKRQSRARQISLLHKIIPLLNVKPITNRLWIVEPDRIRIRGGDQMN